jgi:hypothetical protein
MQHERARPATSLARRRVSGVGQAFFRSVTSIDAVHAMPSALDSWWET